MWADDTTGTLTLSSSNKFGTTSGSTKNDDQGNTWTCVGSNIQNSYQSTYSGQQFGTSKTNNIYTFSADFSGKTVTGVSILAAAGNTTPTYNISVGGHLKSQAALAALQRLILQAQLAAQVMLSSHLIKTAVEKLFIWVV